jgi:cytoskeletal protein CcmA (bactofilin family)
MSLFNRSEKSGGMTALQPAAPPKPVIPSPAAQQKSEDAPLAPAAQAGPAAAAKSTSTPSKTGAIMASVISKALKITGELESTEDIQIDGQIEGDVRGVGVKIGQTAKVKGTVRGEEVELAGTIDGKIESKKVILTGTARMNGDVWYQDIKVESGAYINGSLKPELGKADAKLEVKPEVKSEARPGAKAAAVTPPGALAAGAGNGAGAAAH